MDVSSMIIVIIYDVKIAIEKFEKYSPVAGNIYNILPF